MKSFWKDLDRTHASVAIGVWLLALAVYVKTQAPTLSFWDCGEFIATSYILGIPHPPGTPTYILFGRLASMVPIFEDISARINFFSGLCSATAAMFAYLLASRMLRSWFGPEGTIYSKILTYAGAAAGALFLAFGRTQWNNSVEAEVYGMSMMLVFAIAWLAMVYFDKRGTILGDKLMLLVVYLAFLGIGVHMTTFLILPVVILIFIFRKDMPSQAWFLPAIFFGLELYLIFALSSRPDEIPFYFPVAIVFGFFILYMMAFERIPKLLLMIGAGFLAACIPAMAALQGWSGTIWNIAGLVPLAGLTVFSVYLLIGGRVGSDEDERPGRIAAWFVITAVLLSLLHVIGLQGYKIFMVLSILLAGGLGLLVWRYVRWPILIALAASSTIILGVREFFWGMVGALVILTLLGMTIKPAGWKKAVLIILIATAGYSTHAFVPIRSAMHPFINENTPSASLEATINFFERKQYGSQSMTERMFVRRGEWENQFGSWRRMGYWGFFQEQFGLEGKMFLIPFLIGLFGIWEACRRRPHSGSFLAILILVSSVGLVLYMNFADGARRTPTGGDWLEVRDRDYFFTPAFMFFGLAIGLGLAGMVAYLRDLVARFSPGPRRVVLSSVLVVFLLPAYALANNYYYCNRSTDYIPYDFALNNLLSADPNAILFNFGDNDTFPLWCLQEVYGIRKDVSLINCSLANGTWYIKQVRDYMNVDLGWTDQDIDELRPYRLPDGRTFRLQDQVVDAVISHNSAQRPINFSVMSTPSSRRYRGEFIDSVSAQVGMGYRYPDPEGRYGVNIEESLDLFMNPEKFQYRGWNNRSLYKNETTMRSLRSVADKMLTLAEAMIRDGRMDEAIEVVRFAVEKIPDAYNAVETLAGLYAEKADTAGLAALWAEHTALDIPRSRAIFGRACFVAGDTARSIQVLTELLAEYPSSRDGLNELMTAYIAQRDVSGMLRTLQIWLRFNPDDSGVKKALVELQRQLEGLAVPPGDGS